MAEKTAAEVRASSLQYRAVFAKPIIAQWGKVDELAQALFEALGEWNVSLENIASDPSAANFGQVALRVQLLQARFTFRVGLDAASLWVWNPDWTEISTIKGVASAGVEAIRQTLRVELGGQDVTLDIHLTPQGRSRLELTSRFLPSDLKQTSNDFEGCGFLLHRKNKLWHIDLSAWFPDALYLRLFRSFAAAASFDEIASTVQQEEVELLDYLGLSIPGLP